MGNSSQKLQNADSSLKPNTREGGDQNLPNHDEELLQQFFQDLCDSSNSLEKKKQALDALRNAYVPDISSSSSFAKELSRVFELRFPKWPMNYSVKNTRAVADCVRGIIFGAAVGDATGLATEFLSKFQIESYFDSQFSFSPGCEVYPDIHRVSFPVGDWTDDTDQLIVALITFLQCEGRMNAQIFAEKLHDWKEKGFSGLGDQGGSGLGKSTKAVIQHATFLTDPFVAAKDIWERSGRKLAPNGALMRTAITAVPNFWDSETVKANTLTLCTATHADPRCQASCVYLCSVISQLLQYWSNLGNNDCLPLPCDALLPILQQSYEEAAEVLMQVCNTYGYDNQAITTMSEEFQCNCHFERVRVKSISDLQLDDAITMGYTYKCLSVAIWSLMQVAEHQRTFPEMIQLVVKEGGDSDTNAAVVGALLGSYLGVTGIPPSWISAMPYEMWLEAWVQKLLYMLNLPITRKQLS